MKAKFILMATVALCLLTATVALADKDELVGHPGYVDFRSFDISMGEEPNVEVNIGSSLMRLVGLAAESDEPELSNLLQGLIGIRVEVYNLDDRPSQKTLDALKKTAKDLEAKGWETIVRVREDDQQVYIAIKPEGKKIVGLVVLSAEEDNEIALVNIVGNIDLDQVWRLGNEFDIDHLDSVHSTRNTKKSGKP